MQDKKRWMRLNGPARVGLFFAALAIVLSVVGLVRANNLSLRNLAIVLVLCGGVWGVISWAIATAVVQVEEDVAAEEKETLPRSREERQDHKEAEKEISPPGHQEHPEEGEEKSSHQENEG